MIEMTISAKGLNDIDRSLARLGNQANKVMARAANSAMSNVSKNMKKEVSSRYNISSGEVGKTLYTEKANSSQPHARIISRGEHPNLAKFKVSPMRSVKTLKAGGRSPRVYKASVKKGSSLSPLDGSPKPFIATLRNGFTGVFQRKNEDEIRAMVGRKRNRKALRVNSHNNIKGVYGPAVPQMIKNQEIMDRITEQANQVMQKRMAHEIERILG